MFHPYFSMSDSRFFHVPKWLRARGAIHAPDQMRHSHICPGNRHSFPATARAWQIGSCSSSSHGAGTLDTRSLQRKHISRMLGTLSLLINVPEGPIGPPRKIGKNCRCFCIFPSHAKNGPRLAQMGPGGFFSYPSRPCRHFGRHGF